MVFTITTNARRPTKILSHTGCFSITRGILSPSFHFIQIHPFAACTTTHNLAGFSACGRRKSARPAGRARSHIFLPNPPFCKLADSAKNQQWLLIKIESSADMHSTIRFSLILQFYRSKQCKIIRSHMDEYNSINLQLHFDNNLHFQ